MLQVPHVQKPQMGKSSGAATPPVEHQEALTEYPWDDKDSLEELDQSATGNFADDNNAPGAPNNQAGIYSESANNIALKFGGICLTTEKHHETDELKIISDATALHYPIARLLLL